MDRRKFVTLGTVSVCMAPLLGTGAFLPGKKYEALAKPKWLIDLVKFNDADLKSISAYKITDPSQKYFGGYQSDVEIPNPHSTCAFINRACAAVSSAESVYYQSQDILRDIRLALQSLLKMQHSDGTIDLVDTNFHSTPRCWR